MVLKNCFLEITYNCNCNCKGCYVRLRNETMDFDNFKLIIDRLKNTKKVFLLGGEPTLHKDLENMIDYLKFKKKFVGIITNGTNYKEFLKKADEVQISIDYFSSEKEDKHRGLKGCFERQIKTLEKLPNAFIRTTIMNDNYEDCLMLVQFAKKLNTSWVGTPYKGKGRTPSISQLFRLDAELKNNADAYIDHPLFFSLYETELVKKRGYFCPAGLSRCKIDVKGSVGPCLFVKDIVGSVFDDLETLKIKLNSWAEKHRNYPICMAEL